MISRYRPGDKRSVKMEDSGWSAVEFRDRDSVGTSSIISFDDMPGQVKIGSLHGIRGQFIDQASVGRGGGTQGDSFFRDFGR